MKAKLRKVSPGIYSVDPQDRWKRFLLVRSKRQKRPVTGKKVATKVIRPGLLEVNLVPESSDGLRTWKVTDSRNEKQSSR